LAEAKSTEKFNLASLEHLTRMEEERKKLPTTKKVIHGPMIRFVSKDGANVVTWTDTNTFPDYINGKAPPCMRFCGNCGNVLDPRKAVCVVTGLPAKYLDPTTSTPFATIQAFKNIKEK
jgi:vacuolar protein sorting-associated protein 72